MKSRSSCRCLLRALSAALLAFTALLSGGHPAQGQAGALTFTNDGGFTNGFTGTLGWQFTANQNVTLTDIGIYNAGLPVDAAHQVGLFNVSGALLDSGTVGPSAGDTVNGFFDFAPATPYSLQAGKNYIIGELLSPDDFYYYDPSSIATDPSITYVQTQYDPNNTPSLTFPSTTDFPSNGYGYFGPNFEVQSTASGTPEPNTAWICISLLAACSAARYRYRRP